MPMRCTYSKASHSPPKTVLPVQAVSVFHTRVSYTLLQIIVKPIREPSNICYSMNVFVLHTSELHQNMEIGKQGK